MKKVALIAVVIVLLVLPLVSLAQINEASKYFRNLNVRQLVDILLTIAKWFLALIGIIAVIMALWSAFLFITTGAESEEKRNKAKQTLIYAIIGTAVAIAAFSIVTFTQSLLEPRVERDLQGTGLYPQCVSDANCRRGERCQLVVDPSGISYYGCR